jgi:hypothetical protein
MLSEASKLMDHGPRPAAARAAAPRVYVPAGDAPLLTYPA